ncbi:MAG: tetratricopeptide repeat protein, partial [Planctomycetota bacterium]
MPTDRATYLKVIKEAFEESGGDFISFREKAMGLITTGLPEKLLITTGELVEKETNPLRSIWLRFLIAEINLNKRDLEAVSETIKGIYEDDGLPKGLRAYARFLEARKLMSTGKFEAALDLCRSGMDLYKGDEESVALHILVLMGQIACSMGKFNDSLEYYQKSIELEKELTPGESIGLTYMGIAITYHHLGDTDKSCAAYNEALRGKMPPKYVAQTISNLANLYYYEGDN